MTSMLVILPLKFQQVPDTVCYRYHLGYHFLIIVEFLGDGVGESGLSTSNIVIIAVVISFALMLCMVIIIGCIILTRSKNGYY